MLYTIKPSEGGYILTIFKASRAPITKWFPTYEQALKAERKLRQN